MAAVIAVATDIQYLKGVGPALAKKFQGLGLRNVHSLLYYFPFRYENRSRLQTALDIPRYLHKPVLLRGQVLSARLTQPRPRFYVVNAQLRGGAGSFSAVWFNQKFMAKTLRPGLEILISGKVVFNDYAGQFQVDVADYEIITADFRPGIVPVYALTDGLTQKKLRQVMRLALAEVRDLRDPLPPALRQKHNLPELPAAVRELHFPSGRENWRQSRQRIVFDEFFYVELGMALRYARHRTELTGISFQPEGRLLDAYYQNLPYQLTAAQQRVIGEVLRDMAGPRPMNRLVQGDVGSGKTDVAVAALLCAVQSGYQAALMVPTEVLAQQHFLKIEARLKTLGVRVESLLGRHPPAEKKEIYRRLAAQECDVVIGTQAIIQDKVVFKNLGFVIIDEQHRFGVVQRQLLKAKAQQNVDLLVMTATPIPRTLALTVYGDLDKSLIDELPPGRAPVQTYHVRPRERAGVYELLRRECQQGFQAYIVYPLVAESEKIDLQAAVESYEQLCRIFPEFQLGLLHGRLKNAEKEIVMQKFRDKELQILVSTTVIEVGVDVPNATLMIIENANRFGLAQLHQLRGRVGRGARAAQCFLITELKTPESKKRIQAMTGTTDGFRIAELDLEIRGPGDFVGVQQSGFPDFIMADLLKDEAILQAARTAAFALVQADPRLERPEQQAVRAELRRRSRGLIDYILLN
ncbi:MAG: ATP-dependent DNA helicase RecG [Candidatus Margulisbacteria bacterium]|jgi:ATP-dependent DNA helicase RecG|nr:ATP-dependent DNA helicase RecG [Candidatus Margulisiibacteriota bacterium]